jgi:hypothetical protein
MRTVTFSKMPVCGIANLEAKYKDRAIRIRCNRAKRPSER